MKNVLRILLISGVFLLVVLVPFIHSGEFFFPYIAPRNFFFRIVVELLLVGWLVLILIDPGYRPRLTPVLASFGGFVAVMGLANLLGVDPANSFWSNFERMEGYITLLHLAALLVVMVSVLRSEKIWRTLLQTSLITSVLIGLWASAEYLGDSPGRLSEPLGNPIYLAAYLLFHIFLSLMFMLKSWQAGLARTRVWLYGGGAVFLSLVLFGTGTRGAILGLVVGGLVVAGVLSFDRRLKGLVRGVAASGLILVILGGGFLTSVVYVNNLGEGEPGSAWESFRDRTAEWPVAGRFAEIDLDEGGEGARFTLWQIALQGARERPITGWGQENFIYVFAEYYDPVLYDRETWFDRAHNMTLEWLMAGGILGLLGYLSLFGVTLWVLWRQTGSGLSRYERAALTAAVVAYFIHNLFVFDFLVSYMVFTVILGFVSVQAVLAREPDFAKTDYHSVRYGRPVLYLLPLVVVLTAWGVWSLNLQPASVSIGIIDARKAVDCARQTEGWLLVEGHEWSQILENLPLTHCRRYLPAEALNVSSAQEQIDPRYLVDHLVGQGLSILESVQEKDTYLGFSEFSERAVLLISDVESVRLASSEVKEEYYEIAEEVKLAAIDRQPDWDRSYVFAAYLYLMTDQPEPALEYFKQAHQLAPTRQLHLLNLVEAHLQLEDHQAARQAAKQAYELDRSFLEPAINYAVTARYLEKENLAREVLDPWPEEEYLFNDELLEPLEYHQKFSSVIELREKRIEYYRRSYRSLDDRSLLREGDRILSGWVEELQAVAEVYEEELEEVETAQELYEQAADLRIERAEYLLENLNRLPIAEKESSAGRELFEQIYVNYRSAIEIYAKKLDDQERAEALTDKAEEVLPGQVL